MYRTNDELASQQTIWSEYMQHELQPMWNNAIKICAMQISVVSHN
jgi:hypothetical protein